jgi:peptidoglycan/xylan/chitin deacetylase (PgdA/CDA1 family)
LLPRVRPSAQNGERRPEPVGRAAIDGIGPTLPSPVNAAVTHVRSAAWLARSRGRADESGIRILFYHRIADDGDDELAVPRSRFREQMHYLASAGYRVVDVVEVAARLSRGEVPHRTIGLNFDDGYLDVAENALPVLSELGFRATVFVATGVTDGRASFEWDRRQRPLLTWDEIVQLDREGTLEFEAHTVTHPNLLTVDDQRATEEIMGSRDELELRLGRPVTAFSYPAGLFGERERGLVVQAGYRVAASCRPGVNRPSTDRFALRRRQVDPGDRLLDFRAKVGGGHDTPLPLRGVYRRVRYGEGTGRPRLASCRR